MANAEGAVERLYEDTAVRDELRDAEAAQLLKWAEAQLNRLAASTTDEAFDARSEAFRDLLKGINRLIGQRATLDEAALRASLGELSAQAATVGAAPAAGQVGALASTLPKLDDAGAVAALTALFTPNTAESSPTNGTPDAPESLASRLRSIFHTPSMPVKPGGESNSDDQT